MEAIDLTLDSDDELETRRPAKRGRYIPPMPSGSDVVIMHDTGDSDVEEISALQFRQAMHAANGGKSEEGIGGNVDEDDEVLITADYGKTATIDMPHSRSDCAVHRFKPGGANTNVRCCSQCFCYVCDVKASECEFWGTGARPQDHANAEPVHPWTRLRRASKAGDKEQVRAAFAEEDSGGATSQLSSSDPPPLRARHLQRQGPPPPPLSPQPLLLPPPLLPLLPLGLRAHEAALKVRRLQADLASMQERLDEKQRVERRWKLESRVNADE